MPWEAFTRSVVNRLKELAQRQGDINERVKELQTALQEATTEKEKEDAQRELKRLREQEQQLLADLDETKQRMEQAKSAPQLADERKQLEQTRSEAQKAAESMQNGRPSQALAAGTRAQNDLQKLRDDLRKKTAGQFNDALKQMRNDARELARNQEELGQKLAEPEPQAQRTLSGSSPREQLQQKFDEQTRGLGNLRENLRDVSEKAETAEPLLAKELYDALRKSTQAGTDQTLERAGQLATRGYGPQARKFEEKARQEIEDLKKGVERAAESVLGNEAEALRQARAELDALTKELNREIGQANPALADGSSDPKERAAGSAPNAEGGEASHEKAQTGQPRSTAQNREGEGDQPGDGAEKPGGQSGKKEGEPGQQPGGQGGGDTPSTAQTPKGNQPANGGAQEGQPGERPGEGKGQRASTESGKGKGEGGDAKPGTPTEQPGSRLRELAQSPKQRGGIPTGGESGAGDRGGGAEVNAGPLRGDGFVQWSDRLRNVEEMLDQPELRNEAARVREVAESVRAEFKRHSVEPKWDLVKTKIQAPLAELRDRLSEELARRESKEALVPIDRDPVPQKYSEHVRRYYEELGRSR